MSLTIEAGKYYRTRAGARVGPAVARSVSGAGQQFAVGGGIYYGDSGLYAAFGENPRDLVAEWDDALFLEPSVVADMKRDAEACSAPPPPAPMTKTKLLETALQTVADRGVPYGGVEDNFARIAHLWNGYVTAKFADGAGGDTSAAVPQFKPVDVAAMMALMKLGRIAGNAAHMDSWIDLAGYAACGGEISGKAA